MASEGRKRAEIPPRRKALPARCISKASEVPHTKGTAISIESPGADVVNLPFAVLAN